MTKTDVSSNRNVTRRAFLYSSAAMLTEVSVLKSSYAFVPPRGSSSTDYSSAIEKIKQTLPIAMAARDITGASIALVDGDNIVWSEGFGYTNRSLKVKVTGDTLFHAGSISKSFTALGALKAFDKNLIDLDAPLKKYLPWFSVNSRFGASEVERITIRHLLAHHSGLGTWSPPFIGVNSEVKVALVKGHLYLNDRLKLRESSSNSFICADGEAVIFKGEQLLVGNKSYFRKG